MAHRVYIMLILYKIEYIFYLQSYAYHRWFYLMYFVVPSIVVEYIKQTQIKVNESVVFLLQIQMKLEGKSASPKEAAKAVKKTLMK